MLALEETPAEDPKHYAQGAVICSDTAFVPVGLRMNGCQLYLSRGSGIYSCNKRGLKRKGDHVLVLFVLVLFALLPDCSQNQTAVSDKQYSLSDF